MRRTREVRKAWWWWWCCTTTGLAGVCRLLPRASCYVTLNVEQRERGCSLWNRETRVCVCGRGNLALYSKIMTPLMIAVFLDLSILLLNLFSRNDIAGILFFLTSLIWERSVFLYSLKYDDQILLIPW